MAGYIQRVKGGRNTESEWVIEEHQGMWKPTEKIILQMDRTASQEFFKHPAIADQIKHGGGRFKIHIIVT